MKKLILCASTLLLLASLLAFCPGCQTATPSKAQSADIKADVINVTSGGAAFCSLLASYTNLPPDQFALVVDSLAGLASATECNVISQAMTNETGGDEQNSQTATGPTTPVDISVPTGTDAISALVGEGAKGITAGLKNSGDGNAGNAAAVDPNCATGDCAPPG